MSTSCRPRKTAKKHHYVQTFSSDFVSGPGPSRIGVAVSQSLSNDRRRVHRTAAPATLPSPRKKRKLSHSAERDRDDQHLPSFDTPSWGAPSGLDEGEIIEVDAPAPKQAKRRKWNLASDEPLRLFHTFHADEFAEELIRADGRGDAMNASACPSCTGEVKGVPEYRCRTCFGCELVCKACFLADHARHPFCRVEKWIGTSFEKVTLQSIGACIQLGHCDGAACPSPTVVRDFTVIHVNGIHTCTVKFCNCAQSAKAGTRTQQLMRRSLFPATTRDPQTACTFEVLRQFQALSLQGKVSLYDYYTSLEKLTEAAAPWKVKDRYKSFMRCVREWKYLQLLRRAGRANIPNERPTNFAEGELAVDCPACPHPGVNLPGDWQKAPSGERYKYALFLALDACFRLKRRKVGSKERDPPLIDGGAYMVKSGPFEKYLEGVKEQTEINTCTGLSALDHANTKFNKGYAEMGKVLGLCARHEFVQKTGVVPTQVGERYANTDYALGSLLRFHAGDVPIVLSYDISRQYSRNLKERLQSCDLPEGVRVDLTDREIRFVIPKLHIHGHQELCQLLYNLNYMGGVGRTDGEGVERPWAVLGPLGTSLRMMGPGSASDVLDDHIGFWNFCKLVALGVLLRRRFLAAIKELVRQKANFDQFKKAQAAHVDEWTLMVLNFEHDVNAPNPFATTKNGATESDVILELANEDEERARQGLQLRTEMSASQYVLAMLSVEDEQRVLRIDVAGKKYTTTQQLTELAHKRTRLRRTLTKLKDAQAAYVPAAKALHDASTTLDAPAEELPLHPPSSLRARERATCLDDVMEIERRLRDAQCRTSLEAVRSLLLIKKRMLNYKNTNARYQGASTRARTIIDNNEMKIKYAAHKYVDARAALIRLANGDESAVEWHALDVRKDLRCMEDDEDREVARAPAAPTEHTSELTPTAGGHLSLCRNATGEGRRAVSWIWWGTNTTANKGTALYEGIRVEWCKAFARVRRWAEEIPLLQEEMRRTLVYLKWTAARWVARARADTREGPLGEGARAYAEKQARTYDGLAAHFEGLWTGFIDADADRVGEKELQALEAAVAADDAQEAIDEDGVVFTEADAQAVQGEEEEDGDDDDGEEEYRATARIAL